MKNSIRGEHVNCKLSTSYTYWIFLYSMLICMKWGFKRKESHYTLVSTILKQVHVNRPSNLPFHRMITNFIMAESARKQLVAACSNKFAIPFVVLTTINLFLFISIRRNTSRYTGTVSTLLWIWFRELLLGSYPAAETHKIMNIHICNKQFTETF